MLVAIGLAAQEAEQRILEKFAAALPQEEALEIYRLDWAPSLPEAKSRAARESRPIFFIATTQLEDAGSLVTGHC